MLTSVKGLALIKAFESCSLIAYPDPASPLGKACNANGLPCPEYQQVANWQELDPEPVTIGWGTTGADIRLGDIWTQAQADARLKAGLHYAEYIVHGLDLPLNQNQWDALVSFAYNCPEAFQSTHTFRQLLDQGDYEAAADEMLKWHYAQKVALPGLMKRRAAERELFLTAPDAA